MVALADNIDRTRIQKIGLPFSCVPGGWPFSPVYGFKLLQSKTVQPYVNPFPPRTSGALMASGSLVFVLLSILFK